MQIIKVPGIDGGSKGCRNSGNEVIKELKNLRDISFIGLEEIHVDNSNLEQQGKLIYENSRDIFEEQEKVVFLGGDQSISYFIGKAFFEIFGREESYLVVFDSRPNAKLEKGNESWLKELVEIGWKGENVFLIGLRKLDLGERSFLDKNKVNYVELKRVEDLEGVCDGVMEMVNQKDAKIYVSFDLSVVDPAFAPSASFLDPGGLSSREIIYFAKRFSLLKRIKAIDLVEVDCEKDKTKDNLSIKLGAQIVNEFLK
jgi:agmatinase